MLRKSFLIGAIALGLSAGAFANGGSHAPIMPVAPNTGFVPGIYIGGQLGYGMSGWNNIERTVRPIGVNELLQDKVSNANGLAGRVFIGYDFHPNFAVELGYLVLGNKAKVRHTHASFNIYNAQVADIRTQAVDLVGKMKVPFNDLFGIYAKAGVAYLMSSGLQNADPIMTSGKRYRFEKGNFHNFNVVYGLGLNYNITPSFVTELSWTQYKGNPSQKINTHKFTKFQADVNFFAIGISYKFGL